MADLVPQPRARHVTLNASAVMTAVGALDAADAGAMLMNLMPHLGVKAVRLMVAYPEEVHTVDNTFILPASWCEIADQ